MCLLRCLGVEDVICPLHRPDLKPFVERTIQTLKYEWLARYSPRTVASVPRFCCTSAPSRLS